MKIWNFRLTIIAGLMMVAAAAWGGNNDITDLRGKVIGTPKVIGSTLTTAQLDAANVFQELTGKAKCDVTVVQINYQTPGVQPGEMTNASAAVLIPGGPDCPGPFPLVAFSRGTKLEKAYTNADSNNADTMLLMTFFASRVTRWLPPIILVTHFPTIHITPICMRTRRQVPLLIRSVRRETRLHCWA